MLKRVHILILILMISSVACNLPGSASLPFGASPTPIPTFTPIPTNTPPPTPTSAPEATEEPEPTDIPEPTATLFVYSRDLVGYLSADTNFRTGPGTETEVIRQLQGGLPVYLQARNGTGTWVQIVPNDAEEVGWVAYRQVETVSPEEVLALPIAEGAALPPAAAPTQEQTQETQAPPPTEEETEEAEEEEETSAELPPGLQPGVDLIRNGSFEQPYISWDRPDGGGRVAHDWEPWWFNDPGNEFDGPEYVMANINVDQRRIKSGEDAQQYFRPCARHMAGVLQVVEGLAPGIRLRFSVYGHAWSTDAANPDPTNSRAGGTPGDVIMKIGIDPTGGKDALANTVVWSEQRFVYDNHEQFVVEATTQGSTVTVFTFSSNNYPVCTNNVYWDDARLEIPQ